MTLEKQDKAGRNEKMTDKKELKYKPIGTVKRINAIYLTGVVLSTLGAAAVFFAIMCFRDTLSLNYVQSLLVEFSALLAMYIVLIALLVIVEKVVWGRVAPVSRFQAWEDGYLKRYNRWTGRHEKTLPYQYNPKINRLFFINHDDEPINVSSILDDMKCNLNVKLGQTNETTYVKVLPDEAGIMITNV